MSTDEFPTELTADYTGYDPVTETVHAQHEWDDEQSLAITIVRAVTAVTNAEPTAMDPLYESIDPDALERLLRPIRESENRSAGAVQFTFDGHAVTVTSDGGIRVECDPEATPPIR